MVRNLSLILVLAFTLPGLIRTAIIGDYALRYQSYLLACENADKPELHCNGKCHLKAKLQTAAAPAEAPLLPDSFRVFPVFFYQTLQAFGFLISPIRAANFLSNVAATHRGFLALIGIPPEV